MKKCPYCAEDIQDDAIKCRFCGEFLKEETEEGHEEHEVIAETKPTKKTSSNNVIFVLLSIIVSIIVLAMQPPEDTSFSFCNYSGIKGSAIDFLSKYLR